jgi:exonuclease SbcC
VILERLFIENYKQLRDPVELHPPEGAIGVVGSNGTGKSTLFESVLWAFFGSKGGGPRFANESIPWSGGSTKDPTTVEITLSTEGGSYTVRRRLKSGSTSAEALDATGKTIATGTADVSRWIESNLLRMDRTAFEATFYARQKELRFFANDDGISRVRRISKLLGINSVENAQKLLRDDRNELRSEARVLENRLAEADLDALQAELKEANLRCDELEKQLGGVDEALTEAAEELKITREARAALEAAYRQHSKLLGRAAGGGSHFRDRERLSGSRHRRQRVGAPKARDGQAPGDSGGAGASGARATAFRATGAGPDGMPSWSAAHLGHRRRSLARPRSLGGWRRTAPWMA